MKRIFKNYIFMYMSIFLPKLLGFLVLIPFLSNTLGIEGSGITSYTHNIINYAILFANAGITIYGNKKIAETRNQKQKMNENFCSIFFLQIIFHIITLVIYLMLINFANEQHRTILLVFSTFFIFNSIDLSWFFAGNEDFKNLSISNIINYLIMFIIVLVFIKSKSNILIYPVAVCTARLVSCLYSIIVFSKKYKVQSFETTNLKKHLKNIFMFFIPELLLSTYTIFDQILLGFMSNTNNVALYSRAISYVKLGVHMVTILCTIFFPKFSNLHVINKKKEIESFNKVLDFLLMISIPLCFGFIATSNSFISWYLPYEFNEVSNLIILLAPSIIFMIVGNICSTYLIASDNIKEYSKALFIGAGVNLITNLCLIKLIGPYASVVATIFSEFGVCLYLLYCIKKQNILSISPKDTFKYLNYSIIMFIIVSICSSLLNDNPICTIIEILLGILSYFTLIYISKKSLVKKGSKSFTGELILNNHM